MLKSMRPLPAAVACLLTLLAGGLAACDAPCADCADDLTDGGGGGGGPCTQDRQGCAASSGLKESAVCADGPALTVELGTGRAAFVSLAEGESPPIEYGPQGDPICSAASASAGRSSIATTAWSCASPWRRALRRRGRVLLPRRRGAHRPHRGPLRPDRRWSIEEPGFVVFADSSRPPGRSASR
ncbi:MAG: hypothetical protein R3F43_24205 [bacterium]